MASLIHTLPGIFDQRTEQVVKRKRSRTYSVVSLFSGCGGMDLGFRGGFEVFGQSYAQLPFEINWANDINPAACKTYRLNLKETIHCADIRDIIDQMPNQADVVIGGFPCQDISINGLRKGVEGAKSGLYRQMVEVVDRCKPKVFVAENVKGLLQDYNKDSLRQVLADFGDLGYHLSYRVYLAANYGVPQMRERVFIVGTLPNVRKFNPPSPVMAKGTWMSCEEAIGDLETMDERESFNHLWSRAAISGEQGMRKLKADRPSDTIRAEHHGNIQFHYNLPRRISLREAARLQSFPDNFTFAAKMRETERQIGNAVPPVLAWHIAKAVEESLEQEAI